MCLWSHYIAIVKNHMTGRLKIFKKPFVTVKRTIVKVYNLLLNNHMKYPCDSFTPFVELLSPECSVLLDLVSIADFIRKGLSQPR